MKTRERSDRDAWCFHVSRQYSECFLSLFVPGIVTASWRSAKNVERTIYPVYLSILHYRAAFANLRNGIFAVMSMKSDRNILSTMDLKFLGNFWNDVISRTAIPSESDEAIAVIQDAQVRGFCQISGAEEANPLHVASLSSVNDARTRKDKRADRLPGKEPGPPFIALLEPERPSVSDPLVSPGGRLLTPVVRQVPGLRTGARRPDGGSSPGRAG